MVASRSTGPWSAFSAEYCCAAAGMDIRSVSAATAPANRRQQPERGLSGKFFIRNDLVNGDRRSRNLPRGKRNQTGGHEACNHNQYDTNSIHLRSAIPTGSGLATGLSHRKIIGS